MGEAVIKSSYHVSETNEMSMDWKGNNYLVIYGKHINGWFIAVPNWECSTEAGHPSDTFYNTERLSKVLGSAEAAKVMAEAVKEHWSEMELLRGKEKIEEDGRLADGQEKRRKMVR